MKSKRTGYTNIKNNVKLACVFLLSLLVGAGVEALGANAGIHCGSIAAAGIMVTYIMMITV